MVPTPVELVVPPYLRRFQPGGGTTSGAAAGDRWITRRTFFHDEGLTVLRLGATRCLVR